MEKLTSLHCKRPQTGERLTPDDMIQPHAQTPEWQVIVRDEIPRLERVFRFKNFAQALAFTNQVGALAEAEDHHPTLVTEWGRVKVTFWTHFLKGLQLNDFIAAAKTDALYEKAEKE